jgi:hypothetical protein
VTASDQVPNSPELPLGHFCARADFRLLAEGARQVLDSNFVAWVGLCDLLG